MSESSVRIVAVGDLMLGDSAPIVGWGYASRWPGRAIADSFAEILDDIRGDIVLGNLEAVLTSDGLGSSQRARNQMRCNPEAAIALAQCGFTTLSVANNHAMQHGESGFRDTVAALESAGISVLGIAGTDGWCSTPVVRQCGHISVGMLGYCWRPRQYGNGVPPYAEGAVREAASDVSRLSKLCDVVAVSLHWGDEFMREPSYEQSIQAKELLDAGAHMIIGHHPHVLQPYEQMQAKAVIYSLGNFASDMLWSPELRTGGLLEATIFSPSHIEYKTKLVSTDENYRVVRSEGTIPMGLKRNLSERQYEALVQRRLRGQQGALYRYAAKNVIRYRAPVLLDLVAQTFLNKVRSVVPGERS